MKTLTTLTLLTILASLSLTSTAKAELSGSQRDGINTFIGVMSTNVTIWGPTYAAAYIYAPAASAILAGALALSSTAATAEVIIEEWTFKKQIKILVNNDLQNYYNTGTLSVSLAQTIELLRQNDSELSDSEALDQIATSINQ